MTLKPLFDYDVIAFAWMYLLFVGAFHALLVIGAALLLVPRLIRSGWARYLRTLRRFALSNALLLAFGILGNALWMAFVYGRLYVSQDTVVDFFPFIPFGQWALDFKYGDQTGFLLNGARLWQLRVLWLLIAFLVWALTILSYRGILRKRASL